MLPQPFTFTLHNWRKFDSTRITIPSTPLCIVDQNGSGKTSVIAALYSLCSSKPWPGLTYKQLLKNSEQYFGISAENDWYLNGSLSPSGRLLTKYTNETDIQIPVMTYLPTDNQWFFLSRTQKLAQLDTLLSQSLGLSYTHQLKMLNNALKNKNALLKRYLETGEDDSLLAHEYSKQVYSASSALWQMREQFYTRVLDSLSGYYSWIESPLDFEFQLQKTHGPNRHFVALYADVPEPEYEYLWNTEKARQRLLYGAQRDEFEFMIGFNPISAVLSRGEMRLFVLFLKYTAMNLHSDPQNIVWLLDDIFNEFDQKREAILFESILSQSSSFVATSTKIPTPSVATLSLSDIVNFLD